MRPSRLGTRDRLPAPRSTAEDGETPLSAAVLSWGLRAAAATLTARPSLGSRSQRTWIKGARPCWRPAFWKSGFAT